MLESHPCGSDTPNLATPSMEQICLLGWSWDLNVRHQDLSIGTLSLIQQQALGEYYRP